MRGRPLIGFVPWIVFWIVTAGPSTWEYGALAAFLTALLFAVPQLLAGRAKPLDLAAVALFGVLAMLGVFLDASDLAWLERNVQAISFGVLAVVALGSLALRRPFTEQYAREEVSRESWDNEVFKQINRLLTLTWGLVFLVCAILGVIARNSPSAFDWLNWVVPIVLVVAAFRFTAWYPDHVAEQMRARARAAGRSRPPRAS